MPRDVSARSRTRPSPRTLWIAGILLVGTMAVIAGTGLVSRYQARAELEAKTEETAIPSVVLYKVVPRTGGEELVLPGNVQAINEAPIYARISGYLKVWHTDIGARVKKGDLLGEIDAPEVEDQLRQSQADLASAEANDQLARSTAKRWQALLATDSVSKQDADEKISDASAKAAAVLAAKAAVSRLGQQKDYMRVVAPFDGVVTARKTDVGALINAGSGVGPELFHVADTTKLRVYVQVPQSYAPAIQPDMAAELHFSEYPGRAFPAKLARSADAIDATARTLLIELQVDNAKGELLPGGYTEVHLKLPASEANLRLPTNTLIFRASGLRVAKLGADNKVELLPITVGRDYGTEIEVLSGVSANDMLVLNPPDSLAAGQEVKIASNPPAGPAK